MRSHVPSLVVLGRRSLTSTSVICKEINEESDALEVQFLISLVCVKLPSSNCFPPRNYPCETEDVWFFFQSLAWHLFSPLSMPSNLLRTQTGPPLCLHSLLIFPLLFFSTSPPIPTPVSLRQYTFCQTLALLFKPSFSVQSFLTLSSSPSCFLTKNFKILAFCLCFFLFTSMMNSRGFVFMP